MCDTVRFWKENLVKNGEGATKTKVRADLRSGFASASGLLCLRDPTDHLNNFANSSSYSSTYLRYLCLRLHALSKTAEVIQNHEKVCALFPTSKTEAIGKLSCVPKRESMSSFSRFWTDYIFPYIFGLLVVVVTLFLFALCTLSHATALVRARHRYPHAAARKPN